MDSTNILARLQETLQNNSKIAIAVGKNAGIDEIGSALALFLSLKEIGKQVSIASPDLPLVAHSSLVGIDQVKQQFQAEGGDLIVSFPYKDGEIDKVSYTLENGYLNIVVKAGELGLGFKEEDVRYSRVGGAAQVMIVVGAASISDLGNLFNPDALKNTVIINIDYKIQNQGYGDIVVLDTNSSSVSEVMTSILENIKLNIDIDIAQNLLSGIIQATNNFQSPNTSLGAFEIAANLMRKGAKRQANIQADQNEDRVSSFMPEQMLSQSASQRPARNPFMSQVMQNPVQRPAANFPTQRIQRPNPIRTQPSAQQMPQRPQQSQMAQEQIKQQLRKLSEEDDKSAQGTAQKPPSDWLTPKVYKGSSDIS